MTETVEAGMDARRWGDELQRRTSAILTASPSPLGLMAIGRSREGREIRGLRIGSGGLRVSLIAGCHADEPVGPRLLYRLASYLETLSDADPLLERYEWWLIPHMNPDGAERNSSWQARDAAAYDLVSYLAYTTREKPGEDMEFNFPRAPDDEAARPENRSVYRWWREAEGPFSLHVSLHGMGFSAGPWFLIEPAWRNRYDRIRERCIRRVETLGYRLHDVEREGEKGFFRLERGFCTRPDSRYMREHFIRQGDEETANRFLPSSMECIRSLGGDPLTLVSEIPLFITPGVGDELGPPDPVAEEWRDRITAWRAAVEGGAADRVGPAARDAGLRPMPVSDQMTLQWTFVAAGLEQVQLELGSGD